MKWIKETYRFPSHIKLLLEIDSYGLVKWDNMISVTEDLGHMIHTGYGTYSTHHFNMLAWDGEFKFLGIHYRQKPLNIGDPKFFEKLDKTIVRPTLKNYLYFPSNVFHSKPRQKHEYV